MASGFWDHRNVFIIFSAMFYFSLLNFLCCIMVCTGRDRRRGRKGGKFSLSSIGILLMGSLVHSEEASGTIINVGPEHIIRLY